MSADAFEKHAGKIIGALVCAAILAGATATIQIDKRLALLEAAVARDSGLIWTASQQATYEVRVQSSFERIAERVTRMEQAR